MIGIELYTPQKPVRQRLVYEQHVFTGCSGENVLRLLPPLTFTKAEADEFVKRLETAL
jgi:acetylornithine aminotransferase